MTNINRDIMGRLHSMDCCGVVEYAGINKPNWRSTYFYQVLMNDNQWKHAPFGDPACAGHSAYIITAVVQDTDGTGARGYKNVAKLKKYTKQYNLGTLIESGWAPSGKYQSTHLINTLVFVPNRDVLIPFAQKKGWLPELDKSKGHNPVHGGVMWGKNVPIIA